MPDFFETIVYSLKRGVVVIDVEFLLEAEDIMVRGGKFYAVFDHSTGLWSKNVSTVVKIVDRELARKLEEIQKTTDDYIEVRWMRRASTKTMDKFVHYVELCWDKWVPLDHTVLFNDHEIVREDHATFKLPYTPVKGDMPGYLAIMNTLYDPEERFKFEWDVGSILCGDSKKNHKFSVLYGPQGSGKSTVLKFVRKLLTIYDSTGKRAIHTYCTTFNAKDVGNANRNFSLTPFKDLPLVAIQEDGDLSRIDDNTTLNTITAHEELLIETKHKDAYPAVIDAFLFMGSNTPVMITDAQSGLLRRLIDIRPSGRLLPEAEYEKAKNMVDFELGAIAWHCMDVYKKNKHAFDNYKPLYMMEETNELYNFVVEQYYRCKEEGVDGISFKVAYDRYTEYCNTGNVRAMRRTQFKRDFKVYFEKLHERYLLPDGSRPYNYYQTFREEMLFANKRPEPSPELKDTWLIFEKQESQFDKYCAECPAQYAVFDPNGKDKPDFTWAKCDTKLYQIDTSKLHYVKVPINHIVVDFDIPGPNGEKCFDLNFKAASKWKPTYAELSKSGGGIHLHYIYLGNPLELSSKFDEHIEIKVYTGLGSLRRMLTLCNDLPIAEISSNLPKKEVKEKNKMINDEVWKHEQKIYALIKKALNKQHEQSSTTCEIQLVKSVLDKAYENGTVYDATKYRNALLNFALASTHQADYCHKMVCQMHFRSKNEYERPESMVETENEDKPIIIFDFEVYPNKLYLNYKYFKAPADEMYRYINPSPEFIYNLFASNRMVGYNCRRYDNHIAYARSQGYTNMELFKLSQKIVNSEKGKKNDAFFSSAWDWSWLDVYDMCSVKQSLKKWEIALGMTHKEMNWPWDKPVPDEMDKAVSEYCDNDVLATEAVLIAREEDFNARIILASVAGMVPNDTTNSLTTAIVFGNNKHPQSEFNYRNLGDDHDVIGMDLPNGYSDDFTVEDRATGKPVFPGYKYSFGVSTYRGEEVGEGGYVYAEPGMYTNVALLDIASMHPSSTIAEQLFGYEYTKRFEDIVRARLAAKHGDLESAKTLLDGQLMPYLNSPEDGKALAAALKLAINSVYGLTKASFEHPFRDPRNVDNIVAKRGALFMVNLKHAVQNLGYRVAHIKTDSIKIPDADEFIIQFVTDYGKAYGYNFEHEATYDRMCLVNDAVYIAKYKDPHKDKKTGGDIWWTATGKQFQVPYVFKTLFSKEGIEFKDVCEAFSVQTSLYLDHNESINIDLLNKAMATESGARYLSRHANEALINEIDLYDILKKKLGDELDVAEEDAHSYKFVGKVGLFTPIKPGLGGGLLVRSGEDKEGNVKYGFATGAKGYRWAEAWTVGYSFTDDPIGDVTYDYDNGTNLNDTEDPANLYSLDDVDLRYFEEKAEKAKETINKYGDFEWFVSDDSSASTPAFLRVDETAGEELPFDV